MNEQQPGPTLKDFTLEHFRHHASALFNVQLFMKQLEQVIVRQPPDLVSVALNQRFRTVEIGWIITTKGEDGLGLTTESYDFMNTLGEAADAIQETKDHPETWCGNALCVEIDPHDGARCFISHHTLGHGETDLAEPRALGMIVRQWLVEAIPDFFERYDLRWGIIETER